MAQNAGFPRKPRCKLIGEDGNVFAIMGRVRQALIKDGQPDRAAAFLDAASTCESYGAVLALLGDYVDVR